MVNTDPVADYTVRRGDRIAQLVVQRVEAGDVRGGGGAAGVGVGAGDRRLRPHRPLTTAGGRGRDPCRRQHTFGRVKAFADVAQLVEHNLAKVGVAGSNPVVRSTKVQVRGYLACFFRVSDLVWCTSGAHQDLRRGTTEAAGVGVEAAMNASSRSASASPCSGKRWA